MTSFESSRGSSSDQRVSFDYNFACKRAMSRPVVAHQFELEWPWPTRRSLSQVPGTSPDHKPALRGASQAGTTGSSASGGAPSSSRQKAPDIHLLPRCYHHRTHILDFAADPFPEGSGCTGSTSSQRVSLLLSPGHRFYIPLQAVPAPVVLPKGGTLYWRTAYKPAASIAPDEPVPVLATELVVGHVGAVEWTARQWRDALTQHHAQSSTDLSTANSAATAHASSCGTATMGTAVTEAKKLSPQWLGEIPVSQQPVASVLFHSVPAAVRWLPEVPDCLLVSLPCEERIVTVRVPRTIPGYAPGRRDPVAVNPTHEFQLCRGTVPLDIAPIYQRPFVAVGTYEHGVLLCRLGADGAVGQIVRRVSMAGQGSTIFPVARIAAVFPPRQRPQVVSRGNLAQASSQRFFASQQAAEELASLADGALICSSPLDPTCVVVKQLHVGDGAVELFGSPRELETLLHVAAELRPDVGVLVTTHTGRVMRLQIHEGDGRRSTDVSADSSGRSDGSDEDAGSERNVGAEGKLRQHFNRHAKSATRYGAIAERVSPVVFFARVSPSNMSVMRTLDSAVVYQRKVAVWKPTLGRVARHFMLFLNRHNELVLMDRSLLCMYKHLATVPLTRGMTAGSVVGVATGVKRERSDESNAFSTGAQEPDDLVDYATGAVFLSAGEEWVCAAVAHHCNLITVITYDGRRKSLKQ